MFRFLHIAGLAALALVLPGCAEMHLTKPGADTAAVSRDLGDCRALALRSAGPAVAPASSTEGISDQGRPRVMSPTAGSNEGFVAEHEATSRCMAKRGYALRQQ
jgi:hypothetical protein